MIGQQIHGYRSTQFQSFTRSSSRLSVARSLMKSWIRFMFNQSKSTRTDESHQRDSILSLFVTQVNRARARMMVSSIYYTVTVQGNNCSIGSPRLQVAQVRVVFQIPQRFCQQVFPSSESAALSTIHLAYVELFSVLPVAPDPNYLMYRVSRLTHEGCRRAIIIPVDWIICSVHLFPQCGPVTPQEWDSISVLENCRTFYVNPFSDRDVYLKFSQ